MIILQGKEYKSIAEAARQHGLTKTSLNYRIKKCGQDYPHLFDKVLPWRDFSIVLQGKKYKSIKDAARKHHVWDKTLRDRIKKYGPDSPLLFKHNRLRYNEVIIKGIHYDSITDAAKALNIPRSILAYRLKMYGSDSDLLLISSDKLKNVIQRPGQSKSLTVNGVKYPSLAEYCRQIGVSREYAQQRFAKYGYNHPILEFSSHAVELNGRWYNSIKAAAKAHHIKVQTLRGRIRRLGHNNPHLFQSVKHGRQIANENVTNHINEEIAKIHQQGLLLPKEVAQKANLSLGLIHHAVLDINQHSENNFSGIRPSDIVEIKSNLSSHGNTIHCFKPSVLAHIQACRQNLPNLQLVPQCDLRYYYDPINKNLYSTQGHSNGNLKLLKRRSRNHFNGWRINAHGKKWEIDENDIQDLLDHPNLTINDLITGKQIMTSYNLTPRQFYTHHLNHKLKLRKRFDIKTGKIISGYYKGDLLEIITNEKFQQK